jgi:hypothetical protein
MSQAVRSARLTFAVRLEIFLFKDCVEKLPVRLGENQIGRLRLLLLLSLSGYVSVPQSLERPYCAGRAFAVADTALSAHFDLKDGLFAVIVVNDGHIPKLEAGGFIRS